jgi:protoheme IX farnesyltransferase
VVRHYYELTKPGIIYGNLITTAAGYFLASKGVMSWSLFLAIMAGTSLVIASACVFNNYIDRSIDIVMARTKRRALVEGTISGRQALVYGVILGLAGGLVLARFTNWLTVAIGALAFVDYVVLYGVAKRRSVHGTIVGSLAGSAPILAGYTAVTGHIDAAAVTLFVILTVWQMPHFYAIAIYRFDDYKAARLPVLPIKQGIMATKRQIVAYIVAFIVATQTLTLLGYTGFIYSLVMGLIGLNWLRLSLTGFGTADDKIWARRVFFFSLVTLLVFSVMVSFGAFLL